VDPTWEDVAIREIASAQHQIYVWVDRNGLRQRFIVTPALEAREGTGTAGWDLQNPVVVVDVIPGLDAAKVGLRPGDVLKAINGTPIRSIQMLLETIAANGGKPAQLEYERDGKPTTVTVTPTKSTTEGQTRWAIGFHLRYPVIFTKLSFPEALKESIHQNAKTATLIYEFLRGIIERKMSPKSLQSPIGIAQASGAAAREGATAFFGLMAMVSLNLAVVNMLPIPILDGGVILMLLVEMLMRRDLSLKVKETVFKLGFVFLMAVVAFAIYNDISKLAG
jgi:regulator of sigma E protease